MKKLITTTIAIALFASTSIAQDSKFQSGFIYHFTKYIAWPSAKTSGDFVIGLVGNQDLQPYLEVMAKSKTVGSQRIVVKKFSSVSEVTGCHIVFLDDSKTREFTAAKSKANSQNFLLITEHDGLGSKGAGINFTKSSGRLIFEINESGLKESGLKVNNKLLALGKKVG